MTPRDLTGDFAEGLVLGIDEAGRGSLVGPLVVGGFLTTSVAADSLPGLGVRDSKMLSPSRRDEVYARLGSVGRRLSISLSPSLVDRHVVRHGLNLLEAWAFSRLIHRSGATRVFADACDPIAPRFERTLERLTGGSVTVDARHQADVSVPVVSAASIVAKVRRDRALSRLRDSLGESLGSGYPSDRRTVEFVRVALENGGALPRWLRASWQTTERLKPKPAARTLESFVP